MVTVTGRVTWARVTMQPAAACLNEECGWHKTADGLFVLPAELRASAKGHVRYTGHDVEVEVRTRTVYSAESTSDGA